MSAQHQLPDYTEAQYWAMEATALEKHDFVGGKIYQRAQGSLAHATICGNVSAAAHSRRRGKIYRIFNSDMKIKVAATGDIFYPDATIYCPPAECVGEGSHTLLTPEVLFEVTMPTTTDFDHQGKLLFYQKIETLTDTVLVDAERICVEHFSRENAGEDWRWRLYTQRSHIVRFPRLELELPLEEIYEEVELIEDWVETQMAQANEDD